MPTNIAHCAHEMATGKPVAAFDAPQNKHILTHRHRELSNEHPVYSSVVQKMKYIHLTLIS